MSDDLLLLDGGVGQELVRRAGRPPTPLWSTEVLLADPRLVREVHADFLAAGAEVVTANSYGLFPRRLAPHGLDGRAGELHRLACTLAVEARDEHGGGLVAGSLGPAGWSYRPDLAPPVDEASRLYATLAGHQAPLVDVLLCETMASVDEARGAVRGAASVGPPVWLGVTVLDDDGARLRSGEPVEEVLRVVEHEGVEVLLVNCSPPEAVCTALEALIGAGMPDGVRLGGYANGFTLIAEEFARVGGTVDALDTRDDLTPDRYAEHAARWQRLGATVVGGCCEVSPDHVREVAATLH